MTSATTPAPAQREPELAGQTVVVIGGSAGIGLETARRARAEGAEVILTGRNPDRLEQAARDVGAQRTAAFDANDAAALAAVLPGPAGTDRPCAGHGRRPDLRAAARDGLSPGARGAQRSRGAGARGRAQRRRQDEARRHAAAHGRHRRPAHRPRPRDRLRRHRRAAPVRGGPRARARAGSRQPHRRRLRRHPAVGVAARRPDSRSAGTSCGRRSRSAASSAPPTSPRSPSTS